MRSKPSINVKENIKVETMIVDVLVVSVGFLLISQLFTTTAVLVLWDKQKKQAKESNND
jgi:hypothetical protein